MREKLFGILVPIAMVAFGVTVFAQQPVGSFASFGTVRPAIPTGTGLPRAAQFGLRVSF